MKILYILFLQIKPYPHEIWLKLYRILYTRIYHVLQELLICEVYIKDGQHGQKTHFWTIFTLTFGQREKTLQKLIKTLVRENLKHNNREFIRNGNDWYMFLMTWLSWQLK